MLDRMRAVPISHTHNYNINVYQYGNTYIDIYVNTVVILYVIACCVLENDYYYHVDALCYLCRITTTV